MSAELKALEEVLLERKLDWMDRAKRTPSAIKKRRYEFRASLMNELASAVSLAEERT